MHAKEPWTQEWHGQRKKVHNLPIPGPMCIFSALQEELIPLQIYCNIHHGLSLKLQDLFADMVRSPKIPNM